MRIDVPFSLDGERVDRAVAVLTELPRAIVAEMVAAGHVEVNDQVVAKVSQRVLEGQVLAMTMPSPEDKVPAGDASVPFEVLYEDSDLIVIDKPAGVIVHPGAGNNGGTLVHGLLARFPDLGQTIPGNDPMRPGIVHRLDAGTSGLMVVARTPAAYDQLVADIKARTVERRYLTLVWGAVQPEVGMIEAPIGRSENDRTKMAVMARGRDARTRYQVLRRHHDPELSWVAAKLETGRTHQIRVHFNALGHPVVGDRRYGGAREGLEMHRPFLHARSLRLAHPVTGVELSFMSPLPADLQAILRHLDMNDEIPVAEELEDTLGTSAELEAAAALVASGELSRSAHPQDTDFDGDDDLLLEGDEDEDDSASNDETRS